MKQIVFILLDPSNADVVDGLGRTGVMYAVHFQQHQVLQYLLEQKSDVNYQAHGKFKNHFTVSENF